MGLAEAGSILAIANGFAIVGRIAWGWIGDRFAAHRVLGALALGMAAGMMGIVMITNMWPYAAVAGIGALIGVTAISWNGVFLAETARQSPPGRVSEAMGGVMFVTFTGSVIGPPALTALLAATGSYTAGFLVLAVLALAMAAMFFAGSATVPPRGSSTA
jgi:MFS family permease